MSAHKSIRSAAAFLLLIAAAPGLAATLGAPENVNTETVDNGIKVSWTAPDGSPASTSYTLRWELATARNPDTRNVGGVTTYTLTGLIAGATYTVQVRAEAAGSEASAYAPEHPMPVEAGASPSPPGPPENVRATAVAGGIRMEWDAPADAASFPNGILYELRAREAADTSATYGHTRSALTTATIPRLKPGVAYAVQVAALSDFHTAHEKRGAFAPEPALTFTPEISGAPGAPRNLRVTSAEGELTATWEAPEIGADDRLTGYRVHWEPTNRTLRIATAIIRNLIGRRVDAFFGSVEVGGDATTHTVSGLKSDISYKLEITALNDSFRSESASATATPLPGKPRNVSAAAKDGALHVSWDAPDDGPPTPSVARPANGESAYTYLLSWKPVNGSATEVEVGALTYYAITGLANGGAHAVKVAARNAAGDGAYSDEVTATPDVPDVPRNLRASSPKFAELLIEWDPPERAGVYSYALRWKVETAPVPFETGGSGTTTYTITDLPVELTYKVEVAAHDAGGGGQSEWAGVAAVPLGLDLRPFTPGNVTLTPGPGGDQLTASWEIPKPEGDTRDYKVELLWGKPGPPELRYVGPFLWGPWRMAPTYKDRPSVVEIDEPDSSPQTHTFTGLEAGRSYSVEITALAVEDAIPHPVRGEPAIAYITLPDSSPEDGAPGLPRRVVVLARDGALDVEWQKPVNGDAGFTYEVHWKKHFPADAPETTALTEAGALAHTITGLDNGDLYLVKVAALNANGKGEYSDEKYGAPQGTPPERPGPPRNIRISTGDHTLTVKWDKPSGGAPVGSYSLRWRPVNVTNETEVSTRNDATLFPISGLQPGTTYEVQVAARNAAGPGTYSPVRQAATKPVSASTLDINEDGAINAADGILLSRFALGVRGAALVKGQAHFRQGIVEKNLYKIVKIGAGNYTVQIKGSDEDALTVARILLGDPGQDKTLTAKVRELAAQFKR
ncbi:MAG: fibronectin type III domain-containing protein [Gammaproteobacteria bacterium]|nr:fibronectin type III domain-containing protein [Gammaproteobacteria bacterium]